MTIWYVASTGTKSEREIKRYKTAAGAKQRCRSRLSDWNEFAAKFNVEMSNRMQEVSKEIDGINMAELEDRRPMWEIVDGHQPTGDGGHFTYVIEIWTEETS